MLTRRLFFAAIIVATTGLAHAPIVVEQMARTIGALKAEGLSVVLSEQNLHFARAAYLAV